MAPSSPLAAPPTQLLTRLAALGAPVDARLWTQLPIVARRRLLEMPTEGRVAERTLIAWAHWLRTTFGHPYAPVATTPAPGLDAPEPRNDDRRPWPESSRSSKS